MAERGIGFEVCEMCRVMAAGWRDPMPAGDARGAVAEDPLAKVSRASAAALFGLHVVGIHPAALVPQARPGCADCRALTVYVREHGEGQEVQCGTTAGELLRQHLLGHLIELVPAA